MGKKPDEKAPEKQKGTHRRHLQYSQDSWTELDAEGSDSEMAQGRESQEPFYTPLVTEAAERKLEEEKKERARQQAEEETETPEE